MDNETNASLNKAMRDINKKFGIGTVMKLGEEVDINIPVISTGSILLDLATGKGGFPQGRIVELYGPQMGG